MTIHIEYQPDQSGDSFVDGPLDIHPLALQGGLHIRVNDRVVAGETSRRLMDGNKRTALKLVLSFVGWWLLVLITLGLAALYVQPYFSGAYAQLYLRIIERDEDLL